MYSFNEIRLIFTRCKDSLELERACECFSLIIKQGGLPAGQEEYARVQAHVRFRQLKAQNL